MAAIFNIITTKKQLISIFLLFFATNIYAQIIDNTDEWKSIIFENLGVKNDKERFLNYDFSLLWTKTDNTSVHGFIGDNYQRLRIKIISVKKDSIHSDIYKIYGKSMVKNYICEFRGTIKINSIRLYQQMHFRLEDTVNLEGIKKEGILTAAYHFEEDSSQQYSGMFEGTLISCWYIDKNGLLNYDFIENYSDNYRNNQFIGTWINYKNKQKKTCNWGDYRAPYCGDLDEGAGEFSPNDPYLKYGWQTYHDANSIQKSDTNAVKEEEWQWWKK